jgi:4-hydroxyphenylpyruvate dioxygenase-like putative hemolysin
MSNASSLSSSSRSPGSGLEALGLGPIEQVAYVVEDMQRALPRYEALFGSFAVSEQSLEGCTVRGRQADLGLVMATNNDSPVEIELIQPTKGESPWTEHLERHGEGLHHVRFRIQGLEQHVARLEAQGFETLLYKRFGPEVAFAYLETPAASGGHVIELLEMPSSA